jgi:hypothetical protein
MSRYKVAAALAALALSAAVVTALAGGRSDVSADAVPQVTADVAADSKPNPAADVRGDVAPGVTPDVAPAAAKGDRLAVRVVKPDARSAKPDARSAKPDPRSVKPDARPVVSACPAEPWPFGCQWRERSRKVIRASRPS